MLYPEAPQRRLDRLPAEIARFDGADITEAELTEAALTLVDTMACHYLSRTVQPAAWAAATDAPGVAQGAELWWTGRRLESSSAVFFNAFLAHVGDFDCIHYLTGGHPAVVILPPVLALRDRGEIDLDRALRAYLVGLECMAHLGDAVGDRLKSANLHLTAVLGAPAAAAACGWALGAADGVISAAMAFAASAAGGSQRTFGGVGKAFQVASAARTGYEAAHVGRLGAHLPGETWSTALMDAITDAHAEEAVEVRDFWSPSALRQAPTHFKQAPVCAYFDEPIRILLDVLRSEPGISGSDGVDWALPSYVFAAHKFDEPESLDEARFSLKLVVALVLAHRDEWDQRFHEFFTAYRAHAAPIDHVQLSDNGLSASGYGDSVFGALRFRTSGGACIERTVRFGWADMPELQTELPIRKLRRCVSEGLPPEQAEELLVHVGADRAHGPVQV